MTADRPKRFASKSGFAPGETEDLYRKLVENAGDGIAIVQDGLIRYVNPQLPALLGYTKEDVVGTAYACYLTPDSLEKVKTAYRGLESTDSPAIFEATFIHRNGDELDFEINSSIIPYRDKPADFVIFRSLEERRARRRLVEKMLRGQKLDSLGVLAGGISHDFNNLLQGILGNADLALMYKDDPALVQTCLKDIKLAAQKASGLALQMLAYSGKGACDFEAIDINSVISETETLLEAIFSRRAHLEYELESELPTVRADRAQLGQVLVNLVTNAAEAIGDSHGLVTVSTGRIELTEEMIAELVAGAELQPGAYIYIDVTDTGVGIAPELQDRIFDPFFTTKFTGRGLGLATVFGIVRAHFGAVSVSSALRSGTTIRVYLPIPGSQSHKSVSSVNALIRSKLPKCTVLLVDDDATVRSTAARILERFGYAVVEASNGRGAIHIFEKNQDRIHLVLLDMMMPQMGGKETYLALRQVNPEVRAILMSGYDEHDIQAQFDDPRPTGFLQKPFTAKKLIDKIREILGQET